MNSPHENAPLRSTFPRAPRNSRRVVITGMGTVNPLGSNVPDFWKACAAGTSGVRLIDEFGIPPNMSQIAGIVDQPWIDGRPLADDLVESSGPDRSVRFAITAAREALAQAGLEDLSSERVTVSISSAIAAIMRMEAGFTADTDSGRQPLQPATTRDERGAQFLFNTTSSALARTLGVAGERVTVATGCTGALDAVGHAVASIRAGVADVVISGGAEAPITPLVVGAFSKINATSLRNDDPQGASRPWSMGRDGFVLAEGCGVIVLESLEHARARGAQILAEVGGFASVNNHFHMTSMPADGGPIARSVELALEDAGIDREAIDCFNAHGSSTPQNDLAESNAFADVFGDRSSEIPCTSIKSQAGHALSAANAIELITCVMTLIDQQIPPTLNHEDPDPECNLDVVAKESRPASVNHVLKTSSGFSGIHSSLVVSGAPA